MIEKWKQTQGDLDRVLSEIIDWINSQETNSTKYTAVKSSEDAIIFWEKREGEY